MVATVLIWLHQNSINTRWNHLGFLQGFHLQKLKDYFEGNAMKSLVSTIEREIKDLVAQATNPEERHV